MLYFHAIYQIWDVHRQMENKTHKTSQQQYSYPNQVHMQNTLGANKLIQQKIDEILVNRRLCFMKDRMYEYYGQNFPINYKPHYGFEQKWQHKSKNAATNAQFSIKFRSKMEEWVYSFIVVCNSLALWLCTTLLVIEGTSVAAFKQIILVLVIIAQIFEFLLKLLRKIKCLQLKECLSSFFSSSYKKIVYLVYFGIKVASDGTNTSWTIILDVLVLFLLYLQTKKLYNSLRVANFSSHFEYHFKVADLIITLLIIGHIMALVLYSSTKAGYDTTWLSKINVQTEDILVLYLYAFYFSITTILTVGYGDISATNPIEVLTVVFVQICGIVMLAYIINEIGFCLSSLRKDQQFLQKDLLVLQKMKKQYFLQEDLAQRVNEYLVNSYQKAYQLTPEEEQGVIKKLNQQLRNQIQKSSLISIVKSSIFLVCRWTYTMQKAVSLKLVHTLFSPNDTIYQPLGKQRLYFIRSGKIGVYADLKVRKSTKKLLKTIDNKLDREISNNCYGYTGVINSRPTILQAIAKQFTAAYYITKQHFLQCVCENLADFEYFHEIKNKIQTSRIAESLEVPFLVSSKQHYSPNRHKIILKETGRTIRNARVSYMRGEFGIKNKKTVNLEQTVQANQILSQETINRERFKDRHSQILNTFYSNGPIGEVKSVEQVYERERNELTERVRKTTDKYTNQSSQQKNKGIQFENHFAHFFESGKEYTNYFSRGNRQIVLLNYEKQSYSTSPLSNRKRDFKSSCKGFKKFEKIYLSSQLVVRYNSSSRPVNQLFAKIQHVQNPATNMPLIPTYCSICITLMLLNQETTIKFSKPLPRVTCFSIAYKDTFVMVRVDQPCLRESIVHFNGQGEILYQRQYDQTIGFFGQMSDREVIVLNVKESKTDIINLEDKTVRAINHQYLFDDPVQIEIQTFPDSGTFCVIEKGDYNDNQLRLSYYAYANLDWKYLSFSYFRLQKKLRSTTYPMKPKKQQGGRVGKSTASNCISISQAGINLIVRPSI